MTRFTVDCRNIHYVGYVFSVNKKTHPNLKNIFFFCATNITETIKLPEGNEIVMPIDNSKIIGKLANPIVMEKGGALLSAKTVKQLPPVKYRLGCN
jgi:hypothetical protein